MTSRGLKEPEFEKIADVLHRTVEICKAVQAESGKKLVDFKAALEKSDSLAALRKDVEAFAASFPMPGFPVEGL
jgi:glycine hydroxymethyltransferase